MRYADIIVDITLEKLDRTFQYAIPEELTGEVRPGVQVTIPFGAGGRTLSGFVLTISDQPKIAPEKIKPIICVNHERYAVQGQLVSLAAWMAEHFGSTMNQALKTVLPAGKKGNIKKRKIVSLSIPVEEAEEKLRELSMKKRHSVAKERLLEALVDESEIPWEVITGKLNINSSIIRGLEKDAIAEVREERTFRNPLGDLSAPGKVIELNESQKSCVDRVLSDMAKGENNTYLLYGVTGSGKTEVYMELIRETLSAGKEAIVLIPEIALTYQTVMRFYRHFGDQVSILNSRMSEGERTDQIDRARKGDCKIMIGPRSALFTPFQNLGLIIIDEEHENSYKSEQAPKYHARDVAIERARLAECPVILGSATPSVESYRRAERGEYVMLRMPNRVADRSLPECEIVDLRSELKSGNRSILSMRLQELMEDRLAKQEQTMLFLNRRGMMGSVSCRACGKSLKCPHCDVSLSLHRDGKLHCHYCGHVERKPNTCPHCGSEYIGGFKVGTEMVEDMVKARFPEARVLRMDADTTKGKEGHKDILEAFANKEADILVGTQMIVKGHDFPNVTLVGALAADLSLNASDYRGPERTFQLLTQAAGRAGRGEKAGSVVIQTYQPDHYSILAARDQDYAEFYEEEILYRQMMHYPPEGHMLQVLLTSPSLKHLTEKADEVAGFIRAQDLHLRILGPEDDRIAKLQDVYRKTVYLKDSDYDRLVDAKNRIGDYIRATSGFNDVYVWFDFDPQ